MVDREVVIHCECGIIIYGLPKYHGNDRPGNPVETPALCWEMKSRSFDATGSYQVAVHLFGNVI